MSAPLGRFTGYPEADYHADPGVGSGGIKLLADSPAAYDARNIIPFDGSDATDFGSAFHMALLQPERFVREVYILDHDVNFATKEGKALKAEHEGKIILKPQPARVMNHLLSKVPMFTEMLGLNPFTDQGESEVAYFWDEQGVRGKALVDRESTTLPWVFDVKTTRVSLDERTLSRYALDFGWPLQAAWYKRGISKVTGCAPEELSFVFLVFQTTPPFSVRVVSFTPDTFVTADLLIERALRNAEELATCTSAPRDPRTGWLELRYPDWFKADADLA
jgi:hypothetical protein